MPNIGQVSLHPSAQRSQRDFLKFGFSRSLGKLKCSVVKAGYIDQHKYKLFQLIFHIFLDRNIVFPTDSKA